MIDGAMKSISKLWRAGIFVPLQVLFTVVALMIPVASYASCFLNGLYCSASSGKRTKLEFVLHDSMPVTSIAWSPDGKFIAASSSQDRRLHVWDVKTRKVVHEFVDDDPPNPFFHDLAWSPDGKYLAACYKPHGGVAIIDTKAWSIVQIIHEGNDSCKHIVFSDDGQQVALMGSGLSIYEVGNWRQIKFFFDIKVSLEDIAYIPGTHTMVMGGDWYQFVGNGYKRDKGRARVGYVWVVKQDEEFPGTYLQVYQYDGVNAPPPVTQLAVSPDGKYIAAGTATGNGSPGSEIQESLRVIRIGDKETVAAPLDGREFSSAARLTYTSDGRYLILAHGGIYTEHLAHIFDARTNAVLDLVKAGGTIYDLAVNPRDLEFAVSAGGEIDVWKLSR